LDFLSATKKQQINVKQEHSEAMLCTYTSDF